MSTDDQAASHAAEQLVGAGTRSALSGLGRMIGRDVELASFELSRVAVASIADLVGGPETICVGIYFSVKGAADGHLLLLYEPTTAYQFVDLLMLQPPGTTTELGEMEESALGEMGNVVCAYFLSVIADDTGLRLLPSTPTVMLDMAGALLDVAATEILMTQDETFLAEASFVTDGREVTGTFLAMPSARLMASIEGAQAA